MKLQTFSQEYERARYWNKFELGGELGKLILDWGDRLVAQTQFRCEAER